MYMNYNLLKSRTFWSFVVMFLVNGYAAISGNVPAGADVVINLVLTTLGSYFHLAGVQNAVTPQI